MPIDIVDGLRLALSFETMDIGSKFFYFIASLLISSLASAGGPILVDPRGSGEPFVWDNLIWKIDSRDLTSLVDNATAKSWLQEAFDTWKNASLGEGPVAKLDISFGGWIEGEGEDVSVIFDQDGTITDDEFGEGSRKFIAGFAKPTWVSGLNIVAGEMVLNALFVDGVEPQEITEEEYQAVILHEIGHLLNLDHTQLNEGATSEEAVPTMYPVLLTLAQRTLHYDDVIALASLYPSDNFVAKYCSIEGEILASDGEGLQGANVIAYAIDPADPDVTWMDARSYVSGVAYPEGTMSGEYVMGGITPGREYDVVYEEINSEFTGGSSLEPFDPPKSNIGEGLIIKGVVCESGGNVINVEPMRVESSLSAQSSLSAESNDAIQPAPGCGGPIE